MVILALLILSRIFYRTIFIPERLKSEVRKYEGDGAAQFLGSNVISYGCSISFDWFDLSHDFDRQYRIVELPRTDKEYSIQLEILEGVDQVNLISTGTLGLELTTDSGESIVNFNAPIAEWDKGNDYGHGDSGPLVGVLFHIAPENSSSNTEFTYERTSDGKNLIVTVSYRAGANIQKNLTGRVCIESGGYL